ncbi:glycoside hydrolase 100 family protein [bacterium]|nr:glycoside hydrolase 100 family protein [bacterium]
MVFGHNGGRLPFLLWMLVAAATNGRRPSLVEVLVESTAASLLCDSCPEHYGATLEQLIEKEARFKQLWSIAGNS